MLWNVKTKEGKVTLSSSELLQVLMAKIVTQEKPEHDVMTQALTEYLEATQTLRTISPLQLASISFELGYYYRLFKEKNEVEIEGEGSDRQDTNSSSNESSCN